MPCRVFETRDAAGNVVSRGFACSRGAPAPCPFPSAAEEKAGSDAAAAAAELARRMAPWTIGGPFVSARHGIGTVAYFDGKNLQVRYPHGGYSWHDVEVARAALLPPPLDDPLPFG